MGIHEIVLPQTQPETEWVRGRALQKMSPQRDHARLQLRLGAQLDAWAEDRGEVGTEWRFRVSPPGEAARPLVPDIAFVRTERLCGRAGRELQVPALAPDLAVEVLSPDDRRIDIDHKIDVYLRAGSALVIVVDPAQRSVELHDSAGVRQLGERDTIMHESLPGFACSVERLFAVLEPPRSLDVDLACRADGCGIECEPEIVDQVVGIFDTDREAHE